MNTFLGFLTVSFILGLYFWDKKPKMRILLVLAASIILAAAYYQINAVM